MYMMANNETIMKARQAQVSEPEKPVEVEAADSTSDMASSPVTAEDITVTSVIDEMPVHVDTTDSDSVVT